MDFAELCKFVPIELKNTYEITPIPPRKGQTNTVFINKSKNFRIAIKIDISTWTFKIDKLTLFLNQKRLQHTLITKDMR